MLPFHTFAEKYPLMPDEERVNLTENMKENGYDKHFPIIIYEGKILDGRNRAMSAKDAAAKPTFREFKGSAAKAKAFVTLANEHRRHLSAEWQAKLRNQRLERVKLANSLGKSQREIADSEGVSQPQINRDLKQLGITIATANVSTDTGVSVETLAGEKEGLCSRCLRVGAVPNCKMCTEQRQKSNGDKERGNRAKENKGGKITDKETLLDHFGTLVPNRCRDAFADPWIQDTIDFLASWGEQFRKKFFATGMDKRKKFYPFFNAKDFIDGCGQITNDVDKIVEHLKMFRPVGVCPKCQGAGCGNCLQSGLVHRYLYKKLEKAL